MCFLLGRHLQAKEPSSPREHATHPPEPVLNGCVCCLILLTQDEPHKVLIPHLARNARCELARRLHTRMQQNIVSVNVLSVQVATPDQSAAAASALAAAGTCRSSVHLPSRVCKQPQPLTRKP